MMYVFGAFGLIIFLLVLAYVLFGRDKTDYTKF